MEISELFNLTQGMEEMHHSVDINASSYRNNCIISGQQMYPSMETNVPIHGN